MFFFYRRFRNSVRADLQFGVADIFWVRSKGMHKARIRSREDDDTDYYSPPRRKQQHRRRRLRKQQLSSNTASYYYTRCCYCLKGDTAMCASCLRDVCIDTKCRIETPAFFCCHCAEYWCQECFSKRQQQPQDECPLAASTCPKCTTPERCSRCTNTQNEHSCTVCCREHAWFHVDGLSATWISEDRFEDSVPLSEELLAPIYCGGGVF